jgi:signal transduction histidine kinase
VRTGTPVWLETKDVLVARYPHFVERERYVLKHGSWACLPLWVEGRAVGGLALSFATERTFGAEDRAFMLALARQCAQALERTRLYDALAERERRLGDLVGRLLMAQEEERRRVAYEIHDGLAQVAAGAYQRLDAFAQHHRPRSPQTRDELRRVVELVRATVEEARHVVSNLRPTILDDFGLAAAIAVQVDELRGEGWQVGYDEALGAERLPLPVETALFRVAQEALTNVRKHAHGRQARIRLERAGQVVRLAVEDWGRGFVPEAVMSGGGAGERVGLASMQQRVAWLGGHCTVESRPGAGTRVLVEVPLPAADGGAHGA